MSKLCQAFFALLLSPFLVQAQSVDSLPAWAFGGFVRPDSINPVIAPVDNVYFNCPVLKQAVPWESNDTFNPAAVVKNGKIVVLYRAEDRSGKGIGERTSRIGYASSADGLHFERRATPVLHPDNDAQKVHEFPGGCEDPRVAVTEDGTYVMFYTQWNRKVPRLGVATSRDLLHWTKFGPIFRKAYNGKFYDTATKSASIVTRIANGKQVIAKIKGTYFMYWGEHGVYGATSTDLVNWKPVLDSAGALKPFISPRDGYFDSDLTECGPPAVITPRGILLVYNGKNSATTGDSRFTSNSYCAGQVLFDINDPTQPVARLDVPFLRPVASFEKSGQYINGTVFTEGLVYFNNKWFLYYGCADSRVAVAVYDPEHPALPDALPATFTPPFRKRAMAAVIK
ncbi:glycoside hydrolase family 130 protein [Deminuibacter soli]|uniref:Pesticidal protein Cry15Aa n=1 Tax=Deminuibacter soli TaxID=2291815 RepID=A0A3E1NHK0_9BACT|nr:glycoside hydrolase family 130 protein [Deminuibacter soli]RFM27420.1 hypothetical protein DXN05_15485 [Deminuibacter soli]